MNDKTSRSVEISVFTPTMNRGYIIGKLFESLQRQSYKSFEWIVVDDGYDNTEFLISQYREIALFPIQYIKKEATRRGINRSFNDACKVAKGILLFKVDSDDFLSDDALELIHYYEASLPHPNHFAGVSGLRSYHDGTTIGDAWNAKKEYVDCTNLQRFKLGLNGDKAEAYYLKVLIENGLMPEIENEHYTFEGILWNRIAARGYLIRWFGKKIYFTEYLDDGATCNAEKERRNSFKSYLLFVSELVSYSGPPFFYKIGLACRCMETAHMLGLNYSDATHQIEKGNSIIKAAYYLSYFTKAIHFKYTKPKYNSTLQDNKKYGR